ncbi:MAG TPA: UDP-3-O-acyl-N-acetylglucosamine deacetylase [Lacipirellulaceae bacterium]|jgi:UDP-3-O-acyl N-acetylglucosamine deacetylase
MSVARCQRTLCRPVFVDGFGYFSGRDIRVEFRPARADAGIVFVRRDLGVTARVPVSPALRIDVPRRTTLEWRGVRVEMVEHILAALAGLEIDNCEVWVDAAEMPGCDGSAKAFVEALDSAGTVDAAERVRQIRVKQAVRVGNSENWIEARPCRGSRLSVSFDLDYGGHQAIGRQKFALDINPDSFRAELAPCRTFIPEEVAHAMVDKGLGLRVTSQNLLIFGPTGPIDNTLRFPDECVRHKVLDVVGDLALTGCEVIADIVAYRSGHRLHAELAQQLLEHAGTTNQPARVGARRVA